MEKSKVSRPSESSLLGFSFYGGKEGWKIRIAPKSLSAIKEKIRMQTKRSKPIPLHQRISNLKEMITVGLTTSLFQMQRVIW
ncbi:hypothetical protein [Pedobacter ginsengiterrae]|uniref:hypothetical protein n=1 Tax=Pedobacter ginsengiterrae TaxID=871696 RepID=UPI0031D70B6D